MNRIQTGIVLAILLGWLLAGCATTKWIGVEPGRYVVGRGQGETHETAERVILGMRIDRDERVVVFNQIEDSEIVATFAPRESARWLTGCPTNLYTYRMEVLDIEVDPLTIGPMVLNHPILARRCPADPEFVVLGESGNPDIAITFKPQPAVRWRAQDVSAQTERDVPVALDIVAEGIEQGGFLDPATFAVTADPAHGTVVSNLETTGTITGDSAPGSAGLSSYRIVDLVTYTPNAVFVGTDAFAYRICDGDGYCDGATVTVVVGLLPETRGP